MSAFDDPLTNGSREEAGMESAENPSNDNTGIATLDASRECLHFLLDRFFHPSVICAHPGANGHCSRIEDTIRFLARNLEREEQLMETLDYPGLEEHRREHQRLLAELNRMARDLECSHYDNAIPLDFLRDWTTKHTSAFDKPFADFVRGD